MQKYFLKSLLLLITLYIFSTYHGVKAEKENVFLREGICKSVTITNAKDFNRLQNCTVVIGYVRIVQMDFTSAALKQVKASNVEEISEYLMVYHVEGLDSLERLFPKLIIIRGVELLYDQYALVIIENRDLKNIGLVSLLRVLRGSIRIEFNPSLCFAQTINWVWILGNATKQYSFAAKYNKPLSQCPLCYTYTDELETIEVNRHKKCWSLGKFQLTSMDYIRKEKKCYNKIVDGSCLTSCSDLNCTHCTNYVSDIGCVDSCWPPEYRLAFKRQCVTSCAYWGLKQLGIECVEKCPKNYQEVYRQGTSICVLNCTGNFIIHTAEDLKGLSDCTVIDGSLTIELYETHKPIVQDLENTFFSLNEIAGYLKILNSPQIVSLRFFRNLHTIRGKELLENRYSLYVVDNNYLQELWHNKIAILRGCIYFHLNPRLCYEKITELKNSFKECEKISITDASMNSNGERAVCGPDIRSVFVNVTDVNSNSAVVEVTTMAYDDFTLLIGYTYYYKEAPYRNVSKFDSRHGCGIDSWFTDIVVTKRRRHILKNLKPATQYAYFVNSMTSMYYPYLAEHVSKVQYFQTLPDKPGVVAKLFYHSLSTKEIEVHWWPPRITNGIIEKYILQYKVTNATLSNDIVFQENVSPQNCQCPKLEMDSIIPTPHSESYYSRERMLYKDALMNFLLVKKQPTADRELRKKSNGTIIDVEDTPEARFLLAMQQIYTEAIQKQDEAKESYVISHPLPVCHDRFPNIYQCTARDRYEGAIEIQGHRHTYILKNLEPEKTYRISVRACVKDLANGCGAQKVIFAETVSKRLETIIKNLTFHKL